MVLLTLASKQIWPQMLSVAHLKPERVFLLHSEEASESKDPAQRLKRFFDDAVNAENAERQPATISELAST